MAQILDGKAVSAAVREEIALEVAELKRQGVTPGLAVILVGDDPASRVYVNNKRKACLALGMLSEEYALAADTTQEELMRLIASLNEREDIHGILCQLPLPKPLDEKAVSHARRPEKDVDAFHPFNVGSLVIGEPAFQPCTPAGVMELLRRGGIDPAGKRAVVIGRSNIVGKPRAHL
ncbi:MAG: bifunctional 5,10-methylene-tetrahydrofolate dehydrogenase/5,10-methylene-tetrahydrofolate cyclohydrolase, partial [Clostridia bacterium]|nr:bifunctional 5,10-methylene-tetrahydrofolate dehydrogenase/5,10-methylene-tetrahydrofolate cyclohydrolase [Clostridia bacterium]